MNTFVTAVKSLGSPKTAIIGMIALGVGSVMSYGNPESVSAWYLAGPLAFLAVSLLVAITTNSRIYRRGGLLVFHVGLLSIAVLAAIGRLTFFEAHVEMLEGNAFGVEDSLNVKKGPLHSDDLRHIEFMQGRYTVEYHPGMVRGLTHSYVRVKGDDGAWQDKVVGDDRPLVIDGYRFYTSFNKGFAPVLTWKGADGSSTQGAVHMPSYPLFEHKQENDWTTPTGEAVRLWLRMDTGLDEKNGWVLNEKTPESTLVVFFGDSRIELRPGETAAVGGGDLTYDHLATWMGYKIFYDPTLHALFGASMLSVLGLFMHFRRKFSLQPLRAADPIGGRVPVADEPRPTAGRVV